MKKTIFTFSLLVGVSAVSFPSMAATTELPADLSQKLEAVKKPLTDSPMPEELAAALTNLQKAVQDFEAAENKALSDLQTSAKTAENNVSQWDKVKGCDNVVAAVVVDANSKDTTLNDDTQAIAGEIAKIQPAYSAFTSAINSVWQEISSRTENAQYQLAQVNVDLSYLTNHDKDPSFVSNEPPCRCAKPQGSLKSYEGGEVQWQNNQWRYWIGKNSEQTLPISSDVGLIDPGTKWNPSRTPTNMNVTAWVESVEGVNTVICAKESTAPASTSSATKPASTSSTVKK